MGVTKTLRVLLVEDNETHAHLIQRHLSKARLSKIEVQSAVTLAEAIIVATNSRFDAVLLDLSLPDSEITDTLSRFIGEIPQFPTIVLTSLNDLDFASNLVQQGADDFLVKSDIDSQILLRSIRYAIERRKNRDELAKYAARLQRSNEELKSFAHTVAHEVRSPLNIVSCCLALIELDHRDTLESDSIEAIEDAKTAIVGMGELVTDLLEYSQVESVSVELNNVDVNDVFAEAVPVRGQPPNPRDFLGIAPDVQMILQSLGAALKCTRWVKQIEALQRCNLVRDRLVADASMRFRAREATRVLV